MAVNKLESMNALSDKLFNTLNSYQQRLNSVTDKIKDKLKSFALDAGSSFITLHERIRGATSKIKDNIDRLANNLDNSFTRIQNNLKNSLDNLKTSFQTIKERLNNTFSNLKQSIGKSIDSISSRIKKGFNLEKISQGINLLNDFNSKLEFNKTLESNETMLKQMGIPNPEEMNAIANSLEKRWGDSSKNILKTSNKMTNGLGGSMNTNIQTLEQFYEKGGNLNEDMLTQLEKNIPKIREMGISVENYLGVMTNGAKKGISSDDTFEGLKQSIAAVESLDKNKLNKITSALNINPNNLEGQSSFDIFQTLLKEADDPAKKSALASIFTEIGQEAGINFILGLSGTDLDPSKLDNFKGAYDDVNNIMANTESFIHKEFGNIIPYIDILSTAANTILPFILIFTTFGSTVGLVVLGIISFIAFVTIAINKFDEWGSAVLFLASIFMSPIYRVISALKLIYDHWDSIVKAFKSDDITSGFKRIGIVLLDLVLKPVQQLLELISHVPGLENLAGKGADYIKELRKKLDLITPGEEKKKTAEKTTQSTTLYGNFSGKGLGKSKDFTPQKTKEDINTVTKQASQEKRIEIKIDSFIKGGVQVSNNGQGNGMSSSDLETWFKEMFQRIIINAENATN
ncbi:hypothetical protein [Empedobacter tilapiae]